jgi:hypothetical protein
MGQSICKLLYTGSFICKHLSSSSQIRNAQHLNQWKANRNQAVVSLKAEAHAQTDNHYNQTDVTTQTRPEPEHTSW